MEMVWGVDLVHLVWMESCIKKARGVKVCINMHILDCYGLFGGSGTMCRRLGEMMLERND